MTEEATQLAPGTARLIDLITLGLKNHDQDHVAPLREEIQVLHRERDELISKIAVITEEATAKAAEIANLRLEKTAETKKLKEMAKALEERVKKQEAELKEKDHTNNILTMEQEEMNKKYQSIGKHTASLISGVFESVPESDLAEFGISSTTVPAIRPLLPPNLPTKVESDEPADPAAALQNTPRSRSATRSSTVAVQSETETETGTPNLGDTTSTVATSKSPRKRKPTAKMEEYLLNKGKKARRSW